VGPEVYQPTTFMGDDTTVRRFPYEGITRGSFSSQLEGTERQDLAITPFDAADAEWNFTRREGASLRDSLGEPDLSALQRPNVMKTYGLSIWGREIVIDNEKLTQGPFEAFYESRTPDLNLVSSYRAFFDGVRPIPETGGEVTPDAFVLTSPRLAVQVWPSLPGSADELQPAIPRDENVSLVNFLTALGRRDIVERVRPTKVLVNALDIAVQLDTLRTLKNGWADGLQPAQEWGDGYGTAPRHEALDWLAGQFERFYAGNLPRPYLYPTPLGGVQAEWLQEPFDTSLEIDLESHSAEWHCFNLITKASVVEDLNLDKAEAWEWLSTEVKSLGSATE
jgi:hypothetical protein